MAGWIDLARGDGMDLLPEVALDRLSLRSMTHLPSQAHYAALSDLISSLDRRLDHIRLTNGSDEAIGAIAKCTQGRCLVAIPTFDRLLAANVAAGNQVDRFDAFEGFVVDDICSAAHRTQADTVWLANPSTPLGHVLSWPDLVRLAAMIYPVLLVVDEACDSAIVSPSHGGLSDPRPSNVCIIGSLSKSAGIAGVRLGFIAADRSLVERASEQLPRYNVNGPAIEIGSWALTDGREHISRRRQEWQAYKTDMVAHIAKTWGGLMFDCGSLPFVCLDAPVKVMEAQRLRVKQVSTCNPAVPSLVRISLDLSFRQNEADVLRRLAKASDQLNGTLGVQW